MRTRWKATGAHYRSVGKHDLEAAHHLLDLAVTGAVLPGATTRDPSAHRCDLEALRKVTDTQSVGTLQLVLEIWPERSRQHLNDARLRVDSDDALHGCHVEQHTTKDRHRCGEHSTAPTGRCDRNVVRVAKRQHAGNLGRARGSRNHERALRHLASE